MNVKFLLKIVLLIFCCTIAPIFGMKKLSDLAHQEASNLWRGGALTIIHKIEIGHNHKLAKWQPWKKPSYEFDTTGEYIRLYCISPENKEYYAIYDIRNQEKVKTIDFISCGKINGSEYVFSMKNGVLDPFNKETFTEEEFLCQVYRDDTSKYDIAFGIYLFNFTSISHPNVIGAYDFLYKNLLFRLPTNRTKDFNLAVNHNNSMIATNLDDSKDTIVIFYPQLLDFLNCKSDYDININYE